MRFVNINPGVKSGVNQPYTIMLGDRIFFLTHDERADIFIWNMFIDDIGLKQDVEKILKSYLTNRK